MPELPHLQDIVIVFGAALLVLAASHRLRIPPLVGFLLTGVLVGPSGLALVREVHLVEIFAELGVVFLLFIIGLELTPERLRPIGRFLLVGGSLQVLLTVLPIAGIALGLGFGRGQALFLGLVAALSSTAIVLKLYFDRDELDSPHGRAALGILIFQDFLIVPLLVGVRILGSSAGASETSTELARRFGLGLAAVLLVVLLGRLLVPRLLRWLVRTGVRELFLLGAFFACLGTALVTERLGFSLALGAFLAGLLLAATDYRHEVLADTAPFRDVFSSMFFISIGMLFSLSFVWQHLPLVVAAAAALVVVKTVAGALVVRVLRYPWRTALIAGLGLAQIGEFSFVLLAAGHAHGLVSETLSRLAIAAAVLTMLLTPLLIAVAPRMIAHTWRLRGLGTASPETAHKDHVVIVGLGLNGRHLGRVLRSAGVAYLLVDLDGRRVEQARSEGEPVLYGDASRREILLEAGITRAATAVVAVSDPAALRQVVRQARALNPELFLIVRTQRLAELDELRECGADEVIAQEFETSIEIVTRVLSHFHIPRYLIRAQAQLLRGDGYQMLRAAAPVPLSREMVRALAAGVTEVFVLSEDYAACGQTLRELGLRRETGVLVLAVLRENVPRANPSPDLVLQSGDQLVLVGSHAEIDRAIEFLARPARVVN